MAEKRKRHPKLTRIHESRGTLLDIDKDQILVFQQYKRVVGVSLPDQFFTCEGAWKEKDRQFFFDNFQTPYRVRRSIKEEREIPFEIARLTGQQIVHPEDKARPFFKYVLVCNLMPGCRLKVSVDSLARKPEDIIILSGMQVMPFMAAAPMFQPLQHYVERTRLCWAEALRLRTEEEDNTSHENNTGTG